MAAKAFDPFFTAKPMAGGTGLGMICSVATQSGGQVRIRSEPGKGTMVRIDLPRHLGAAEGAMEVPDLSGEALRPEAFAPEAFATRIRSPIEGVAP